MRPVCHTGCCMSSVWMRHDTNFALELTMRAHWIQTLFSFQLSSYCIQDFTLILPQSLLILHLHTTALSKNHCTHTRLLPCPFHIFTPLTLHTVDVHAALLLCYLLVLLSTSLPHHHPCLHDRFTMLLQSHVVYSGTIQKKKTKTKPKTNQTKTMSPCSTHVLDAHLPSCLAT
jgi:hypothetical protein